MIIMLYKREEAFRFQFQTPLPATFKVLQNETDFKLTYVTAEILDLSPNGLRLKTAQDLPVKNNDLILEVTFLLNNKSISMIGTLMWKKEMGKWFIYGFNGVEDGNTEKEIISALKEFAKKLRASKD